MFTSSHLFCVVGVLIAAAYVNGLDLTDDMVECLGVQNTIAIPSLTMDLFPSGMMAGAVTVNPTENLNDTAFVVLKFGDELIDNKEFGTRTIYGLNNNMINPQGIPVQKNTESLLAIHKDFAGEWATEKDKVYYDSVLSGEDMTVYLSIIDLVPDPTPKMEVYEVQTLACVMFTLVKP